MATAKRQTMTAERRAYLREVEELAAELRPRFLSGELRGWHTLDGDRDEAARRAGRKWTPPLWRLEGIARARIATSQAEAFRALSLSTHARWDVGCHGARYLAGEAVALDLLAVARRRGWLQRGPGYTLPARPDPTPEALAERERVARGDWAEARTRALEAVPAALQLLQAEDAPAAELALQAERSSLALAYLQAMSRRLAHLTDRAV